MNTLLSDTLVVVNGPEDGTEFPLVKRAFRIGNDAACEVNLPLDRRVDAAHVSLSVVSKGYRVRRGGPEPVLVDGKPAGKLRSRIVRPGGTIQVGNSLLCLQCPAEGQALHAHGSLADADVAHFLGRVGHGVARTLGGVFGAVAPLFFRIFGKLLGLLVALGCLGAVLYFLLPRVIPFLTRIALWLSQIRHLMQ